MQKTIFTRTILFLSFVSLCTDMASDMLYPVMPVYLRTIGFSAMMIGMLEGIAQATAGLSKGYFGEVSDRTGVRSRFVQFGYGLSAISKPLLAIFSFPLWVFFSRTLDRFGKGMREAPRDAMLSDEATPETKGRIFGFHRGMDTTGAVIGPLIALLFLYFFPHAYRPLFLIAFLPGIGAVALTLFLRDKKRTAPVADTAKRPGFFSFFGYWKKSSPAYRRLVVGLFLFALFNSSDFFLLLKMKYDGSSDNAVIIAYIFYNVIYALTSFPLGTLGDRLGLRNVMVIGLLLFTLVYGGFAHSDRSSAFFVLIAVYGVFSAATEGISKALISNSCFKEDTATAIGLFTSVQSVLALAASLLTGFVWMEWGADAALYTCAGGAFVAAIYLWDSGQREMEKQRSA